MTTFSESYLSNANDVNEKLKRWAMQTTKPWSRIDVQCTFTKPNKSTQILESIKSLIASEHSDDHTAWMRSVFANAVDRHMPSYDLFSAETAAQMASFDGLLRATKESTFFVLSSMRDISNPSCRCTKNCCVTETGLFLVAWRQLWNKLDDNFAHSVVFLFDSLYAISAEFSKLTPHDDDTESAPASLLVGAETSRKRRFMPAVAELTEEKSREVSPKRIAVSGSSSSDNDEEFKPIAAYSDFKEAAEKVVPSLALAHSTLRKIDSAHLYTIADTWGALATRFGDMFRDASGDLCLSKEDMHSMLDAKHFFMLILDNKDKPSLLSLRANLVEDSADDEVDGISGDGSDSSTESDDNEAASAAMLRHFGFSALNQDEARGKPEKMWIEVAIPFYSTRTLSEAMFSGATIDAITAFGEECLFPAVTVGKSEKCWQLVTRFPCEPILPDNGISLVTLMACSQSGKSLKVGIFEPFPSPESAMLLGKNEVQICHSGYCNSYAENHTGCNKIEDFHKKRRVSLLELMNHRETPGVLKMLDKPAWVEICIQLIERTFALSAFLQKRANGNLEALNQSLFEQKLTNGKPGTALYNMALLLDPSRIFYNMREERLTILPNIGAGPLTRYFVPDSLALREIDDNAKHSYILQNNLARVLYNFVTGHQLDYDFPAEIDARSHDVFATMSRTSVTDEFLSPEFLHLIVNLSRGLVPNAQKALRLFRRATRFYEPENFPMRSLTMDYTDCLKHIMHRRRSPRTRFGGHVVSPCLAITSRLQRLAELENTVVDAGIESYSDTLCAAASHGQLSMPPSPSFSPIDFSYLHEPGFSEGVTRGACFDIVKDFLAHRSLLYMCDSMGAIRLRSVEANKKLLESSTPCERCMALTPLDMEALGQAAYAAFMRTSYALHTGKPAPKEMSHAEMLRDITALPGVTERSIMQEFLSHLPYNCAGSLHYTLFAAAMAFILKSRSPLPFVVGPLALLALADAPFVPEIAARHLFALDEAYSLQCLEPMNGQEPAFDYTRMIRERYQETFAKCRKIFSLKDSPLGKHQLFEPLINALGPKQPLDKIAVLSIAVHAVNYTAIRVIGANCSVDLLRCAFINMFLWSRIDTVNSALISTNFAICEANALGATRRTIGCGSASGQVEATVLHFDEDFSAWVARQVEHGHNISDQLDTDTLFLSAKAASVFEAHRVLKTLANIFKTLVNFIGWVIDADKESLLKLHYALTDEPGLPFSALVRSNSLMNEYADLCRTVSFLRGIMQEYHPDERFVFSTHLDNVLEKFCGSATYSINISDKVGCLPTISTCARSATLSSGLDKATMQTHMSTICSVAGLYTKE